MSRRFPIEVDLALSRMEMNSAFAPKRPALTPKTRSPTLNWRIYAGKALDASQHQAEGPRDVIRVQGVD